MVLQKDLQPTERLSFSSGFRIGKEAADLHRDVERHLTDGGIKLPLPPLTPRPQLLEFYGANPD